ncbi:hypothetical protein PHLCEN_2v2008 [Hermanssonia centrifuga]|uniref:Uncharacterized protein n=1 Tax=Hermanssonia centrifuga TaxID=98765 RepID=A0A2R6RQH1_9APHY|nr:hypothetical protein PHLCEN_2v2008 [Hermanssonia centrifuga]
MDTNTGELRTAREGPCFAIWVGIYFSPAVPNLLSIDIETLEFRTNISQTSEPDSMVPTTSWMSVEERVTHPEVLERSGGPLVEVEPEVSGESLSVRCMKLKKYLQV